MLLDPPVVAGYMLMHPTVGRMHQHPTVAGMAPIRELPFWNAPDCLIGSGNMLPRLVVSHPLKASCHTCEAASRAVDLDARH